MIRSTRTTVYPHCSLPAVYEHDYNIIHTRLQFNSKRCTQIIIWLKPVTFHIRQTVIILL